MKISSGNTEILLAKGTLVEVTRDEEGFYGAWFLAKVLDSHPKKMEYLVEYQSLPFPDSNELLRELVPTKFVRPLPPLPSSSEGQQRFQVNEVVEAYQNDGSWAGVVSKVSKEEQPGIYSVSFENPYHVLEFESSQLRFHLDWDGHKWVQPQKLEKPCNICGNVGSKEALVTCSKCCEACEHVYCMRAFTKVIPKSWICEECLISPISVHGDQFQHYRQEKVAELSDTESKVQGAEMADMISNRVDADEDKSIYSPTIVVDSKGDTDDDMSFENPNLRFLESSQVLKVVQSMEEFQLMPQRPHFRPLDECEEEKLCNICGNVGSKDALVTCSKCWEACEHVYCMTAFTKVIPKSWICEECLVSPISIQG